MPIKKYHLSKPEILILFLGLVALISIVILVQKPVFHDEKDYLKNVLLINQYGLSKEYFLNHIGSAGPLYSVIHYLLQSITGLRTPQIRLVNIFFLLGTMYFVSRVFKVLSIPQNLALTTLAVPMTYVISGLALTEMPAIFFLSIGLYLIIETNHSNSSLGYSFIKLLLGGLAIGLSIIGRQPFLLILAALPIVFFNKEKYVRSVAFFSVAVLSALLLPVSLFVVWGGLIAPSEVVFYPDMVDANAVSIRVDFFLLCIAYYAIIFILIAPAFYIKPPRPQLYILWACFILFLIYNSVYKTVTFLPFQFLFEKRLSLPLVQNLGIVSGAAFMVGGFYFVLNLLNQLQRHSYPKHLLFYSMSLLLIAVACAKITWGFSSRYTAQALPFIIPVCALFYKKSKYNYLRLLIGVVLGLVSLSSYLFS